MKALSIVVASKNTLGTIQQCLDALVEQHPGEELEILVIDASTDGSAEIARRFKQINLVQANPSCLVPELWKMGIELTDGQSVAFTTANFIPDEDWISELRVLLQNDYAAVGGVFEKKKPDKLSQWAIYFVRYASYLPSNSAHLASQLAADNAVYRRWVFEKYEGLIEDGFWEHSVNSKLVDDGHSLFLTPKLRVSMGYFSPPGAFFTQRFLHGQMFGAERGSQVNPIKRLFYIIGSPLIPLVLFARISRNVLRNKSDAIYFFFSLPWLLFYLLGWSLGELSGYLFGKHFANKIRRNDSSFIS